MVTSTVDTTHVGQLSINRMKEVSWCLAVRYFISKEVTSVDRWECMSMHMVMHGVMHRSKPSCLGICCHHSSCMPKTTRILVHLAVFLWQLEVQACGISRIVTIMISRPLIARLAEALFDRC